MEVYDMARTGRPKEPDAKHKSITVRIDEQTLLRLKYCASLCGTTMSDVVIKSLSKMPSINEPE
jgi:predicted DNA binding CopG/RHH family protein